MAGRAGESDKLTSVAVRPVTHDRPTGGELVVGHQTNVGAGHLNQRQVLRRAPTAIA